MALQSVFDSIANEIAAAPLLMRTTPRIFKQWQHLCSCALPERILDVAAAPVHMRNTQRILKQWPYLCKYALPDSLININLFRSMVFQN